MGKGRRRKRLETTPTTLAGLERKMHVAEACWWAARHPSEGDGVFAAEEGAVGQEAKQLVQLGAEVLCRRRTCRGC